MIRLLLRPLGRRLRHVRAGETYRVAEDPRFSLVPRTIVLRGAGFEDGGPLPPGDASPALAWAELPEGTQFLALVVEDIDVPLPRPLAHGVAYDLDLAQPGIPAGAIAPFRAPAPIPGHGVHRYVFTLLAVDYVPRFDQPPTRGRLLDAIAGHVIALGELTGTRED